jgi:hypothetical protein
MRQFGLGFGFYNRFDEELALRSPIVRDGIHDFRSVLLPVD